VCGWWAWISRIIGASGFARYAIGYFRVHAVLIYPFLTLGSGGMVTGAYWLLWGIIVIADSPQFSALSWPINAPQEFTVHHLPWMNALGFA